MTMMAVFCGDKVSGGAVLSSIQLGRCQCSDEPIALSIHYCFPALDRH